VRILILNYDYPEFLTWLYAAQPGLENLSFDEQRRVRMDSMFGVADFYSRHLEREGHEALEIHVNNPFIQGAWLRDHGLSVPPLCRGATRERRLAFRRRLARLRPRPLRAVAWRLAPFITQDDGWLYGILARQIEEYRPDIILNQFIHLRPSFFRSHLTRRQALVGQHAAPLPPWRDLSVYDLIVSSLPNLVESFRRSGVRSALHRLAFEPAVLDRVPERQPRYDVTFVGSLSPAHSERIVWLREVARRIPVRVWGPGENEAAARGCPQLSYEGPAWGVEMYRVLRDSRITLNRHIDAAGDHANNLRLYEATGVGTLLVTDGKADLGEMFVAGEDVVTFQSPEECAGMVEYYLAKEGERRAIAAAGQRRTLTEHTYAQSIGKLARILEDEVRRKA
jgi:spore maturation protein CgeB